ncbi:MAG: VWA domain-containing protein [Myxococcaceae bacterium]|jgi:Ca-activated chloride channel family protein|nr:VWA domain-containing protein [Myxococcaceae bacterium]
MNRTSLLLTVAAVLAVVALFAQGGRPPVPSGPVSSTPPTPRPTASTPSSTLSFTAASPHRVLSTTGGDAWAIIDVTADVRDVPHQPVSLAVVVDVSGSMMGRKMEEAKRAARSLVEQLGDGDELTLVAFSDSARRLDLRRMSAAGRSDALSFIQSLRPEGSTNISDGLAAGEEALLGAIGQRRLVLVSDGQPTAGITDRAELNRLAGAAHERGITVTAIGVGNDFDATLMRGMAQWGGGVYGDLRQAEALEVVLADELRQARRPLARNVTLRFRPGTRVQVVSAAGRVVQQGLDGPQVRLPDFGSGATARVLVKLYQGGGLGAVDLVNPRLEWTNADGTAEAVEARLTVPLTGDVAQVQSTRDEALYADVARAFGNEQMMLAAEAMERGDRSNALALLDRARALFGTSADALAGEEAVLKTKSIEWKKSDYDARNESKDMMRKTLKTFGETNNAFY